MQQSLPPPPGHAKLQKTNHMTSFGIIPLLKCFFKNATVVKLYSKGKFFFHVYLSHLVDLLIKNYVRSSGGCGGGDFYTKLRPEGPKKKFLRPGAPLISGSGWAAPPLMWRSRSATEKLISKHTPGFCATTSVNVIRLCVSHVYTRCYITFAPICFLLDKIFFIDRLVIEDSRINILSLAMFTLNYPV